MLGAQVTPIRGPSDVVAQFFWLYLVAGSTTGKLFPGKASDQQFNLQIQTLDLGVSVLCRAPEPKQGVTLVGIAGIWSILAGFLPAHRHGMLVHKVDLN